MKKLKFKLGDSITVYTDSGKRTTKNKIVYNTTILDVIKINKKSIILQNYPTYERVKLFV